MFSLLHTELLKMKRSYMILIGLAGSSVAPFLNFLMYLQMKATRPDVEISVQQHLEQTLMFVMLIIGVMLYGLITTYLFNREYEEDTLKNLLTIPVGRIQLLLSKALTLFGWVLFLNLYAYVLALILGMIGGFGDVSLGMIGITFKQYMLTSFYLFILSFPVIFITLLFKNYVPSIAFTIIVTIGSLIVMNSDKLALYPWTAVFRVVRTDVVIEKYPIYMSYASIGITGIVFLILSILWFNKQDIHG